MPDSLRIAVDGTAASGKGTLAKGLAQALNLAYLDTGALYRSVALGLIRQNLHENISAADAVAAVRAISPLNLPDDAELRSEKTSAIAAEVARIPEVRQALIPHQQRFAKHPPKGYHGAILDGRDIGTIILPDADFKFYCDAESAIRAKRRFNELLSKGETATHTDILTAIETRDQHDKTRKVAPLRAAEDAHHINTGTLSIDDMIAKAMQIIASAKE